MDQAYAVNLGAAADLYTTAMKDPSQDALLYAATAAGVVEENGHLVAETVEVPIEVSPKELMEVKTEMVPTEIYYNSQLTGGNEIKDEVKTADPYTVSNEVHEGEAKAEKDEKSDTLKVKPKFEPLADFKSRTKAAEALKEASLKSLANREAYNQVKIKEAKDVARTNQIKHTETRELTELDKYWQTVRDNPSDFTGWTYLLQYVEQENNLQAGKEAFDTFLAYYPYCYGYWKKYADMMKKLVSPDKAEEVFEQGLRAVTLSVDLWIHYINFYRAHHKDDDYYYNGVKLLFERAIVTAGQDFRSDRLWDLYVNWEQENHNLKEVTKIYDRLFTLPTQLYTHHFEKFTEHVNNNLPKDILTTDEFLAIRQEFIVNSRKLEASMDEEDAPADSGDALPPGVDDESKRIDSDGPPGIEVKARNEKEKMNDAETQFIRERIIERRKSNLNMNEDEIARRWAFEEGIKRPYFHVKPLERAQLKNWREYLDYEIEHGSHERIVILFERCMIACALYEDMWLKYARYVESRGSDVVSIRDVYYRACTIHLPRKPNINLAWAAFEERQGNYDDACRILMNLELNVPELLEPMIRRINIERRRGNHERVEEMYKSCIANAKNARMASHFSVKFARYCYKVRGDFGKAIQVLQEALEKDPTNSVLHVQMVDVGFQRQPVDEESIVAAFDKALASEMNTDSKVTFAQRKLEFLEDFGSDPASIHDAYEECVKLLKAHSATTRKRPSDGSDDPSKDKKAKTDINGSVNNSASTVPTMSTVQPSSAAAVATPAPDASAYSYQQHWAGYAQTPYNYQQPWSGYPASYYPTH